jgi:CRISPR-associated protein Csd1
MALDPTLESEGYSLGMLMAVLERLQQLALGDVNASVVDRYFAAASATPRSVFVRLIKNAQHHARKATDSEDRQTRGGAQRLKRLIDLICTGFDIKTKQYPPRITGLPAHLDLEQQGLFVIGYHQMRHWLWMPKDERSRWQEQHPGAPTAFLSTEKTQSGETDKALAD